MKVIFLESERAATDLGKRAIAVWRLQELKLDLMMLR